MMRLSGYYYDTDGVGSIRCFKKQLDGTGDCSFSYLHQISTLLLPSLILLRLWLFSSPCTVK